MIFKGCKKMMTVLISVLVLTVMLAVCASAATPFTDVSEDAYYAEAVEWAYRQKIADGTGAGRFSPEMTCTRGQVVTLLWRSVGAPSPKGDNPFKDVNSSSYYHDAVLWAVENGITAGETATTFAPNASCTRSQVVTLLWRAEGKPAAKAASFSDVKKGDYFCASVSWALASEVTGGVGGGKFAPNAPCTRGQIVTFLYRYICAAHEHSFNDVVKAPTCKAQGYTKRTCILCAYSCKENYTAKTEDHIYTAETVAPTCDERGYTEYTCKRCGDSYQAEYVAPTGEHSYAYVETIEADCSHEGYIGYSCILCREYQKRDVTPKTNDHRYAQKVYPATCYSQGYTVYTCLDCDYSYQGDFVGIGAHSYETTEVAATCQNVSYTHYKCTVCRYSYTDNYGNKLVPHNWESSTVAPTCTEQGYDQKVCSYCKATEKENIVASLGGHDYKTTVVTNTCTVNGYTEFSCKRCTYSYKTNITLAPGHKYKGANCTVCGDFNLTVVDGRIRWAAWIKVNATNVSGSRYVFDLNNSQDGIKWIYDSDNNGLYVEYYDSDQDSKMTIDLVNYTATFDCGMFDYVAVDELDPSTMTRSYTFKADYFSTDVADYNVDFYNNLAHTSLHPIMQSTDALIGKVINMDLSRLGFTVY